MSKLSKIKDFFELPEMELSPEKRDEIIEKIARLVVDYGLGTPAIMALAGIKPVSYYGSQIGTILGFAFFPLIPGDWGSNLVALFREEENVEKLVQRIEALMKEEDEAKKLEKQKKEKEKPTGKRSLRNLFKLNI